MVSSRILFSLVCFPLLGAAAVIACGDDGTSATPNADGGASSTSSGSGSSSGSTSSSGDTTSSSSGSTNQDSGSDAGVGPCGTLPFGKPAAQFGPVDPDASTTPWEGGIPQGVYDVVKAERASGIPGSWRETFVVGANSKFSRVRQLDLDGGGPNDITSRSGTMTADGGALYFVFDCAIDGDAGNDAATGSVPYELVESQGKPVLRFQATGVRASTEKR